MNKIKELLLKGPLPTVGMLVARILVGGYLVYLSYSLIMGRSDGGINPIALYIFTAIFFLVGVFLLIKAIYNCVAGYYAGGKLDTKKADDEDSKEADSDEQSLDSDKNVIIDVEENEIEELDK